MKVSPSLRVVFGTVSVVVAFLTTAIAAQVSRDQPPRQSNGARPSSGVEGGTIRGRVLVAGSDLPIGGAAVTVRSGDPSRSRTLITLDDGTFVATGLAEGRYVIVASKAGYVTTSLGQQSFSEPTAVAIQRGQGAAGLIIRLPKGSRITGRVSNTRNEPVVGAIVDILRYRWVDHQLRLVPIRTTQTNDRGEYRTWDLEPGEYYVRARAAEREVGGPNPRIVEQPNGRSTGQYAPTYFPGTLSAADATALVVASGQELVADLSFAPVALATVTGSIADPENKPVVGGLVTLVPQLRADRVQLGVRYAARTRNDGTFQIINVPPGAYTAYATAIGNALGLTGFEFVAVGAGEVIDTQIRVAAGATIRGRVRFQGFETPEFRQMTVRMIDLEGQDAGPTMPAEINQRGDFVIQGIRPGPKLLRVENTSQEEAVTGPVIPVSVLIDGREVVDRAVEFAAALTYNATVTMTDRAASISGRVLTRSGEVHSDRMVIAFSTDRMTWVPGSRQVVAQRSDRHGLFEIRGLPPGAYLLTTSNLIEEAVWRSADFLKMQERNAIHVQLRAGQALSQDVFVLDGP